MIERESSPTTQQLRKINQKLKHDLANITNKNQSFTNHFKNDLNTFVNSSKANINQLNQRFAQSSARTNNILHQLTTKYQSTLQHQITLLTQNQKLIEKKQLDEQEFNKKVDKISAIYQEKIAKFELQLKSNTIKMNSMQGVNLIRKLLKNQRFRNEILKRGGDPEKMLAHAEIEQISKSIEQKDEQIQMLDSSNKKINEQVVKMNETMVTFKRLLENMRVQKQNLLKQNQLLHEKLSKSQQFLSKLISPSNQS